MREEFGLPLEMPPFAGRIHPDFRNPDFLEAIMDCRSLLSHPSCEMLLDSRNRVGSVELPVGQTRKRQVVIKEFRTVGVDKLKTAFFPSKAVKAWRGASALFLKGLDTPCPVAFLEEKEGAFVEQSFFLSEKIGEAEEIRHLFPELKTDELKKFLVSLADYLSRCHDEGILHRDLSDGNILVQRKEGKRRFYLIDTNRIKIRRKIGPLRRVKSLIRLGIPRDYQSYFLKEYFQTPRLRKFIWFWYRFHKNRYTSYIDLKKKLRLRQLARKLKIQ
jgi:serine/threonine protein kinase